MMHKLAPLAAAFVLLASPARAAEPAVTLIAGGDVEWSRDIWPGQAGIRQMWVDAPWWADYLPKVVRDLLQRHDSSFVLPLVYRDPTDYRRRFGRAFDHEHWRDSIPLGLDGVPAGAIDDYPFARTAEELRGADIAFVNLEAPISDRAARIGGFLMEPSFAGALARAGIDVVSTANNHMLDAETTGLADTLANLKAVGIAAAGSGRDLAAARQAAVLERKGGSVAILAYSQLSNVVTGFALPDRPGVAPLDPELVIEDIRHQAADGHAVVVSLHWGVEDTTEVDEEERKLARRFVEAGADLILGHGPHMPRGVESYRGAAIVYSLGNFVFGHGHGYWNDNYLARASFAAGRLVALELHPVAGMGTDVGQPYPLDGGRAAKLLTSLREQSAEWSTALRIEGAVASVDLAGAWPASAAKSGPPASPAPWAVPARP